MKIIKIKAFLSLLVNVGLGFGASNNKYNVKEVNDDKGLFSQESLPTRRSSMKNRFPVEVSTEACFDLGKKVTFDGSSVDKKQGSSIDSSGKKLDSKGFTFNLNPSLKRG